MTPKHNTFVVLFLTGMITWISACHTSPEPSASDQKGPQQSELAAIMRLMERHGDEARRAIKSGTDLPAAPSRIDELIEAIPTKSMTIHKESFAAFAKQYQANIEALYTSETQDRSKAYNAIIQTCDNCHTSHCPGPLMKIEKLYLNN